MLKIKHLATVAMLAVGPTIALADTEVLVVGDVEYTTYTGDDLVCTDAAQYGYRWSELADSVGHVIMTQHYRPHPILGEGQTTIMVEPDGSGVGLAFMLPLPEGTEVCLTATFKPAEDAL